MKGGNNNMSITAVDLFCGIGGLTHGLENVGIPVSAGFDIDESCQFSYEKNNNARFICRDVATLTYNDIKEFYPEDSIKILVGCAPCQPFSRYSGKYRKNGHKDDKWKLLYSFLEIIKECTPEIVSMENVPGLMQEQVFNDFKVSLIRLGYNIDVNVVDCASYGVPQRRKRLVLLASRLGAIPLIPPTYDKENYLTVRDFIGNLPPIQDGETFLKDTLHSASKLSKINKKRIQQSKQGGTWRDWDENLKLTCHKKTSGMSFPSVYGRMEWDKPSPTITTQFFGYGNGRFGHPEQDRAISLREGALLQSFPSDYVFFDTNSAFVRREIAAHIGNAVPVKLGQTIGLSIKKHFIEVGVNEENNKKQTG